MGLCVLTKNFKDYFEAFWRILFTFGMPRLIKILAYFVYIIVLIALSYIISFSSTMFSILTFCALTCLDAFILFVDICIYYEQNSKWFSVVSFVVFSLLFVSMLYAIYVYK